MLSPFTHLVPQRSDVGDLPSFLHLAVAQVGDDGLVDAEWPTSALDASEARGHRSRDDDPRHLDIAVDEDLLDVVAEIGHRGEGVSPDRLLFVGARGGQPSGRVDDSVGVEQLVEQVEVAGVTGGQPSKDDGRLSFGHGRRVSHQVRSDAGSVAGRTEVPLAIRQSVAPPRAGAAGQLARDDSRRGPSVAQRIQ